MQLIVMLHGYFQPNTAERLIAGAATH